MTDKWKHVTNLKHWFKTYKPETGTRYLINMNLPTTWSRYKPIYVPMVIFRPPFPNRTVVGKVDE